MSRVDELESMITKYARSYYSGESEVSDEYFDSLVDELKEICPDSEILNKTGWGFKPEGRKVSHGFGLHIGSLSKVKSVESIPERFFLDSARLRISAKLDGLSVVCYYKDGYLTHAVTRGNGSVGLDVTDKMLKINSSLRCLSCSNCFTGAIRGEVVMPYHIWDDNYEDYRKDNPSANPRNLASGIMNRKEVTDELLNLRYVTYKVLAAESDPITLCDNVRANEEFLRSNGFDVAPSVHPEDGYLINEEFLGSTFEKFKEFYPCDGLVFTLMNPGLVYDEIAYKFKAESALVTVTDVTWSPARTGRLAPRVWFEPVELSGAVVKKATAFNARFIVDNKIGVGAVLEVCRSGEVIPHILKVVRPAEVVETPKYCPNCATELVWSGDDLICESENESQLAYRFLTVIAPVEGAGYSLYSQIVEYLGLVSLEALDHFLSTYTRSPAGQMMRTTDEIIKDLKEKGLSGSVTQSKARNILFALTQDVDFVTFIVACSVKGVSWKTAESIADNYPDYLIDLAHNKVNYDKLISISGIGSRTVETLSHFEERLRRLSSRLYVTYPVKKDKKEVAFKVAITGSLSIKRSDFDSKLLEVGIEQSSNFKEIKYLITNNPDSTSSKMRKAKENGVEVISEEEFTKLYL